MERQLMDSIMGVVDNFMRQDKATRRQVLELLKKHLGNFQSDLDRVLKSDRMAAPEGQADEEMPDVDLTEENIREQYMLHELFKPPIVDRDPDEDNDLF